MIQRHQRTGVLRPPYHAPKRRPVIRVVLQADEVLKSSSVIETIVDALYDRMPQANILVCVRRAASEHKHE